MILIGEEGIVKLLPCERSGLWRGGYWLCNIDSTLVWDYLEDWILDERKFFGYSGRYIIKGSGDEYVFWFVGDVEEIALPEYILRNAEVGDGYVLVRLSKETVEGDVYDLYLIAVNRELLSWGVGVLGLSNLV
jgi:hypothetical protein